MPVPLFTQFYLTLDGFTFIGQFYTTVLYVCGNRMTAGAIRVWDLSALLVVCH